MSNILRSIRVLIFFIILLGLVYPGLVTLVSLIMPEKAQGSLIFQNGQPVGSTLIGQDFSSWSGWLQGRPSATADHPYNALASGGSNLTPAGKAFKDQQGVLIKSWQAKAAEVGQTASVPIDLITSSASGLDPNLSLNAAIYQAPLIAKARSLPEKQVETLIQAHAVEPKCPWDPPAYVNVLEINEALGLPKAHN